MYSHRTSISDQRPQQRGPIDLGAHASIVIVGRRPRRLAHLGHDIRDLHLVAVVGFVVFQETGEMKHVAAGEADEELRGCNPRRWETN